MEDARGSRGEAGGWRVAVYERARVSDAGTRLRELSRMYTLHSRCTKAKGVCPSVSAATSCTAENLSTDAATPALVTNWDFGRAKPKAEY